MLCYAMYMLFDCVASRYFVCFETSSQGGMKGVVGQACQMLQSSQWDGKGVRRATMTGLKINPYRLIWLPAAWLPSRRCADSRV